MTTPSTVDAVIITALPFELDAFLHQRHGWNAVVENDHSVKACYWTRTGRGVSILVVLLSGYGSFNAAISASHLIARWRPSLLGFVGTAGGIGRGVALGDVVVASRIVDYEVLQRQRGKQNFQWSVYEPSPSLLSMVSRVQNRTWQNTIHVARPDGLAVEKSRAFTGAVLSSNRVIASAEERASVRSVWPQVAAVDMEAAGVAAAVHASGIPIPLLLFRGICDLADESKDDKWRAYAASIAAAFAWACLDDFEPQRKSPPANTPALPPDTVIEGVPLSGVKHALNLAFDLGQLKQLASQIGFDGKLLSPSVRSDPGVVLLEHLSRQRQVELIRLIEQMRSGLLESFSLSYVNYLAGSLARPSAMDKKKILFLAANPALSIRLALDEEARGIEQRLWAVKHRDMFELKTIWAVRPHDLQDALLREEPTIVHFSGHGSGASGIVLHGTKDDEVKLVSAAALKHLFSILKGNIRVVLLNACYSEEQAEAIAEEIDVVIGMKDSIGDKAAQVFASSFYLGLGFGKSIKVAFEMGIGAIKLENLLSDEDVPVLLVRKGVDASQVILVDVASNFVGGQPMQTGEATTESTDLFGEELDGLSSPTEVSSWPVGRPADSVPHPSVPKDLGKPTDSIQEKTARRIFRVEIEQGQLDVDAIFSATAGLFNKIVPAMGTSVECILLLRTMQTIAQLQRLARPKGRDVDWTYSRRLAEVTQSILAEKEYDLEQLDDIVNEAFKIARAKRLLEFRDEDEWRPGMVSGSGWVEYACLSTIGEKLLERIG